MYKVLIQTLCVADGKMSCHSVCVDFEHKAEGDLAIARIKARDEKQQSTYLQVKTAVLALY